MRISDWSSDLCSSDLRWLDIRESGIDNAGLAENVGHMLRNSAGLLQGAARHHFNIDLAVIGVDGWLKLEGKRHEGHYRGCKRAARSEEHTSELQSLMRTSYAVFCLKKQNTYRINLPKK